MAESQPPRLERRRPSNTRQRRAIRAAFLATDRPLGPNEVLAMAGGDHRGLGIATVYRNIKILLDEGWLAPVALPGEVTHYELAGKEHHHHFHCRACGKVFELNACLPNVQQLAPAGFSVQGHELLLYGACRECAAA